MFKRILAYSKVQYLQAYASEIHWRFAPEDTPMSRKKAITAFSQSIRWRLKGNSYDDSNYLLRHTLRVTTAIHREAKRSIVNPTCAIAMTTKGLLRPEGNFFSFGVRKEKFFFLFCFVVNGSLNERGSRVRRF